MKIIHSHYIIEAENIEQTLQKVALKVNILYYVVILCY